MTSRFSELCIDCRDAKSLAAFWLDVLDWQIADATDTAVQIVAPQGGAPMLTFLQVPEPKTVKNRLHIDVNPKDREQSEEVDRLLALGATRADVGQGTDVAWVVRADPEGNEFCVLQPRQP